MTEVETLARAIDGVAQERGRLERDTAAVADRIGHDLATLDEAVSRVVAERQRLQLAIEDERARLERTASSIARTATEVASAERQAERLRHRGAGQERLVAMLETDLGQAGEDRRVARQERERVAQRGSLRRRAYAAQLEDARAEIARSAAAQGDVAAALAALPASADVSPSLADVELRRGILEAELARAEDPVAHDVGGELAELRAARREQRGRLEAERQALAAEEAALRGILEDHLARANALRALKDEARRRVDAAHHRFASLERVIADEAERGARHCAEAEASETRALAVERELQVALDGERVRLEQLRAELAELERGIPELAARGEAQRREVAEERELRALMIELATLEVALESALAEREELERLLGRMRLVAVLN